MDGCRGNCQRRGLFSSCQPLRVVCPLGWIADTAVLVNTIWQPKLANGPKPMRVWGKEGMMWPCIAAGGRDGAEASVFHHHLPFLSPVVVSCRCCLPLICLHCHCLLHCWLPLLPPLVAIFVVIFVSHCCLPLSSPIVGCVGNTAAGRNMSGFCEWVPLLISFLCENQKTVLKKKPLQMSWRDTWTSF